MERMPKRIPHVIELPKREHLFILSLTGCHERIISNVHTENYRFNFLATLSKIVSLIRTEVIHLYNALLFIQIEKSAMDFCVFTLTAEMCKIFHRTSFRFFLGKHEMKREKIKSPIQ